MLQQYHSFIQEICANEHIFYAFAAYDKQAETLSKDQKAEENQPKVVRCFWANEKEALEACKNEAWQGYRVVPVSLLHFLENWCIDMADEGVLVGINFDNQAVGIEINPLDLILEILAELKRIKKTLYLRDYDNYQAFENAIKQQKWAMKRAEIIANPEKKAEIQQKIKSEQFSIVLCKPYFDNGIRTIDFSCLAGLESVKRVVILLGMFPKKIEFKGFEGLYVLPNLRELDFDFLYDDWSIAKGEVFDLSQCKNLRRYEGQWGKQMNNLSKCISLEVLHLRHFSEVDFSSLSSLKNLRELRFEQTKIKNLNGLQYLSHLEKIEINLAKDLEDVSALNDCPKLLQIKTERCPKLQDIRLKSNTLQSAWLWHKINSLDFVKNCPNLNHLGFKELIDGNLQPIIEAKILNFHFEKKKHYSHGLKELENVIKKLIYS